MKRIWQNFQKEWEVESADHPLILKLRTVSWHWQSFEIHNSRSEQPALSEILKCILLWTANLFVELESYFPWIKNGKKVKVGNLKKNSSNSDFYRSSETSIAQTVRSDAHPIDALGQCSQCLVESLTFVALHVHVLFWLFCILCRLFPLSSLCTWIAFFWFLESSVSLVTLSSLTNHCRQVFRNDRTLFKRRQSGDVA